MQNGPSIVNVAIWGQPAALRRPRIERVGERLADVGDRRASP